MVPKRQKECASYEIPRETLNQASTMFSFSLISFVTEKPGLHLFSSYDKFDEIMLNYV